MALNEMHAEAVAGIVDRVVTRHRRDPTCMLQILREVQEACDWLPPEAIDRLQVVLGVPRTKIEGVAGFYAFLYTQPRGKYRILFSDNVTDRMQGSVAADGAPVQQPLGRAGQGLGRWPAQCRYHFLYRHVRSGAGPAGQ